MTHASTYFLARYQAGDLSDRRSAAVARHLNTCARCTRLSEELSAIPAALASVQAPPMPGIALTRISDALATEAARRAERGTAAAGAARAATGGAGPGDAGQRSGEAAGRVRPFRIPRLRPLSSPVALRIAAAAAAAAVVLAGGGYGLYQLSIPRGTGTGTGAGRASSLAPRAAPQIREPLAAGGGGVTVYYRRDGHLASAVVVPTGTNFQLDTLARDVRASLAVQAGPGKVIYGTHSAAGAAGSPAPSGFIGGIRIASLPGCVGRIAAGHRVITADTGRYQGRPAIVIALAVPQSALADVWVVGAGCSAARSDVLAHTQARI